MGNASSSDIEWMRVYNGIKEAHDEAYKCIDEAIRLEEAERPYEAIEKYKNGISMIDKALAYTVECPSNPDDTWEKACTMVVKMKKTRAEVLMRISSIQSSPDFFIPAPPPPTYDEAVSDASSDSGNRPRTYSELATALEELHIDTPQGQSNLLYTQEHVQLYFISPDGTVTSTAKPDTLNICYIEETEQTPPSTFLQIGEWVYPLVSGVSPCYRSEFGAFILPDITAETPGCAVGLILPPDADATILLELLENILHGVARPIDKKAGRQRRELPGTISNGIVNGAYYISQGLIKGASAVGSFINYGTPKLINRMTPAEAPQSIPPKVTRSFQTVRNVTGSAVQVSGYVASKVGDATMALGRYLAPHIQKQGTKLLRSGFNMTDEEASKQVDGVFTVAAGAVEGIATVYCGLEESAKILGHSLTNNTVKIVEHKYGQPASVIAGDSLYTVGNIYNVSRNVNYFTPKGLAKATAKGTGRAVLEDYRINQQGASGSSQQAYPNLSQLQEQLNQNNPSTSGGGGPERTRNLWTLNYCG